jgi:Ca-activated chloride channel family protein
VTIEPMLPVAVLVAVPLLVATALLVAAVRLRSVTGLRRWSRRLAMMVLVCLILARPATPVDGIPVSAPAVDVFFVVDTTASMGAEDGTDASTRLAGVQRDIAAIVDELAGADFAMITFDALVTVRVPLTHDAAAVLTATNTLLPEVSERSVGSSIGVAAEMLHSQLEAAASSRPDRARAVYYFGDGEQTAARSVESFGASAALIGGGAVTGYGTTAGGVMRVHSGDSPGGTDLIVDPQTGEAAVSRFDGRSLSTIAADLGVEYRHSQDGTAMTAGPLVLSVVQQDGTLGRAATAEFYWVPALALLVLLVWEFGGLVVAIRVSWPKAPRR